MVLCGWYLSGFCEKLSIVGFGFSNRKGLPAIGGVWPSSLSNLALEPIFY